MISLSSWDTISIVDMVRVNQSLAANRSQLMTDFNFSGGGHEFFPAFHCTGQFGSWTLDKGSAGDLLRLDLPITSGNISSETSSVDLSGMTAVMEISLAFLPDST